MKNHLGFVLFVAAGGFLWWLVLNSHIPTVDQFVSDHNRQIAERQMQAYEVDVASKENIPRQSGAFGAQLEMSVRDKDGSEFRFLYTTEPKHYNEVRVGRRMLFTVRNDYLLTVEDLGVIK